MTAALQDAAHRGVSLNIVYSTTMAVVFFLVSWSGVRLSPLGTSATNWPTVPAPDDR
jgi:hypothetical protein